MSDEIRSKMDSFPLEYTEFAYRHERVTYRHLRIGDPDTVEYTIAGVPRQVIAGSVEIIRPPQAPAT